MKKTEAPQHQCEICHRPFSDKRMLRNHQESVHKKVKPFLCNYCGYSTASRSTLKMHMRQHTGYCTGPWLQCTGPKYKVQTVYPFCPLWDKS
ncbi:PR domain zinc finger protein 12 [Portunus trituberculatus]|uniref:PR domain zinc finger protein 12 n=1 Tax=Portunus trituberculatus TaxID=210409 RepID=A0A5B7IWP0_PORTR|nr:PR domain zinc finger protein 12 [Portunus trituberculatus]